MGRSIGSKPLKKHFIANSQAAVHRITGREIRLPYSCLMQIQPRVLLHSIVPLCPTEDFPQVDNGMPRLRVEMSPHESSSPIDSYSS